MIAVNTLSYAEKQIHLKESNRRRLEDLFRRPDPVKPIARNNNHITEKNLAKENGYLVFFDKPGSAVEMERAVSIALANNMELKIVQHPDHKRDQNKVSGLFDHQNIKYMGTVKSMELKNLLRNCKAVVVTREGKSKEDSIWNLIKKNRTMVLSYPNGDALKHIRHGSNGYFIHGIKDASMTLQKL